MGDLVVLPVILICTILGFVVLLWGTIFYPLSVSLEDDWLYFMRERQFKRKLRKNGFTDTWSFLDTLLDTTEKDWALTRAGSSIMYHPYPNTRIIFSSFWTKLEIIEGNGKVEVFQMPYSESNTNISSAYDVFTGKALDEAGKLHMKQVIQHIVCLQESLQNGHDHAQEMKQIAQERAFVSWKEQKKQALESIVTQHVPPEGEVKHDGFTLRFTPEKHYLSLSILFEDVLYFQALKVYRFKGVSSVIHNQKNEQAVLFLEAEEALNTFAERVLTQSESQVATLKSLTRPIKKTTYVLFDVHYREKLSAIYTLFNALAQEEAWLGVESMHQINETFPHDLHALREVYDVMKDKEKVRLLIEESLEVMTQKLNTFTEEAEQNKQKALAKRKLVIERR